MTITLKNLASVPLTSGHERRLADLDRTNRGAAHWRHRKLAEARDLLRLSAVSSVLRCIDLNIAEGLRAVFQIDVPVAVNRGGEIRVESGAIVCITYPAAGLLADGIRPQVAVLHPPGLWHPNVLPMQPQFLCLGPALPAGIRTVELLFMVYRALAMQEFTTDEFDPAGVLHLEAARYWQHRMADLPLTRRPFLAAQEEAR